MHRAADSKCLEKLMTSASKNNTHGVKQHILKPDRGERLGPTFIDNRLSVILTVRFQPWQLPQAVPEDPWIKGSGHIGQTLASPDPHLERRKTRINISSPMMDTTWVIAGVTQKVKTGFVEGTPKMNHFSSLALWEQNLTLGGLLYVCPRSPTYIHVTMCSDAGTIF